MRASVQLYDCKAKGGDKRGQRHGWWHFPKTAPSSSSSTLSSPLAYTRQASQTVPPDRRQAKQRPPPSRPPAACLSHPRSPTAKDLHQHARKTITFNCTRTFFKGASDAQCLVEKGTCYQDSFVRMSVQFFDCRAVSKRKKATGMGDRISSKLRPPPSPSLFRSRLASI